MITIIIIAYIGWMVLCLVMPVRTCWLLFRYFSPSTNYTCEKTTLLISRVFLLSSIFFIIYIYYSLTGNTSGNPGIGLLFYSIPPFILYIISEILHFNSRSTVKVKKPKNRRLISKLDKELISAVQHNNLTKVKKLILQGAKINMKNLLGYTAIDYARGHNYDDIYNFLNNIHHK